jgi:hypothetical protein
MFVLCDVKPKACLDLHKAVNQAIVQGAVLGGRKAVGTMFNLSDSEAEKQQQTLVSVCTSDFCIAWRRGSRFGLVVEGNHGSDEDEDDDSDRGGSDAAAARDEPDSEQGVDLRAAASGAGDSEGAKAAQELVSVLAAAE